MQALLLGTDSSKLMVLCLISNIQAPVEILVFKT